MDDVLIVGGGIAAHTAALYAARAELKPLVLTGTGLDQLSTTSLVENYPGFPEGVQGPDLVDACKSQAKRFGARYLPGDATGLKPVQGGYEVVAGSSYRARTVIIATGASARTLGVPGEKEFWAKGVSTCAPCDAPLFRNKTVVVVGGGDSAMEEALMLTKFAGKVIIVHRREEFRASKIMQQRVLGMEAIEVLWNTAVTEVIGRAFVTGVKIRNLQTGQAALLACDGMFLAIGHTPTTAWLAGSGLALDAHGYIPGVVTNLPGVFAAGDVMDPRYRQAVTSAGTGCQASLEAEKFIEHRKAAGTYEVAASR
ncbi:MAG: FAD-dependent oxidoreductase [Candidatus Aenigmarchaeota archaeon]|nr:FAD-dependent oxidoreductase [Candidatus Aenigmarchaeota archaeon]